MKQVWKRRAVVAAVLVLVGTSVYLNWRYAGDVSDTPKILGQSTLVNGETVDAEAETSASGEDYFSTARLSRKQARDNAIHMLQGVRGSNPRRGTKKSLETQRFQGFSLFVHFLFVSNVLVT